MDDGLSNSIHSFKGHFSIIVHDMDGTSWLFPSRHRGREGRRTRPASKHEMPRQAQQESRPHMME
jgi:hypothetical protein